MKKFLCLLLALSLCVSIVAACSKKDATVNSKPQNDTSVTEDSAQENQAAQSNTSTENEGESQSETDTPNASNPSTNEETAEESAPPASVPEEATNEEVVTSDTAPDVYLVVDGDESLDIYYHLKDCSLLSGLTTQQIPWTMVEALEFRQCPNCNPPRYEGYVE